MNRRVRYLNLGKSGLKVSAVGLGTNNFGGRMGFGCDEAQSRIVLHRALDLGINCIDTSNSYSRGLSEEFIGKALAGGRRHEAMIATKVYGKMADGPNDGGLSHKAILWAVEDSLRRLQTDYIDLYQVHRFDPEVPLEETLAALNDLVRSGKVLYIGCSNFAAWQLADALWTSKTHNFAPFVSVQPHYNMLNREVERELLPACSRFGIGVLPFFPLASGLLTGKYRRGEAPPEGTRMASRRDNFERQFTEQTAALVDRLTAWAEAHGHTMVELAFAWLLSRPQVSSVIAGATKTEQVEANARAAGWQLTAAETSEVDALLAG